MSSQRQGKIARLSAALREELNLRILDGQSGSKILPWLNTHPEVIRVLEEDFEGLHVSDNNLSNWRQGGYVDWLSRRERLTRTKDLAAYSVRLAGATDGKLTEGAAAILSGRVLEILETFDRITEDVDSESAKTPEQLKAMSETLASLSESLNSLRVGDQNNRRLEQNDERLKLLKGKLDQAERALALEQKKFQRTTCELFLKWFDDNRVRNVLAAADPNEAKTQKLGELIFGEEWK